MIVGKVDAFVDGFKEHRTRRDSAVGRPSHGLRQAERAIELRPGID